jgi:CspA family cold shock protein
MPPAVPPARRSGTPGPLVETRHTLDRMIDGAHRGRVKFFKADEGWGVIQSRETPGDVWFHYSMIEGDGYRVPADGDLVEFRYEAATQDSWRYRASWVRRL